MTVLDMVWAATSPQGARHHPAVRTARERHDDSEEWDERSTATPARDNAAERAAVQIDQLAVSGYIGPSIAARGKELIAFLFKSNTVDAGISPDDDGLSFYWAAQEMSLTIIVYQTSYWWSVRNEDACDTYVGEGIELPLLQLQHSLNQFSKEVARRNPLWRSFIR